MNPGVRTLLTLCVTFAATGCGSVRLTNDGGKATKLVVNKKEAREEQKFVPGGELAEKAGIYVLLGLTYLGQHLLDELIKDMNASYGSSVLVSTTSPASIGFMTDPLSQHTFTFERAVKPDYVREYEKHLGKSGFNSSTPDRETALRFEFTTELTASGNAVRMVDASLQLRSTKSSVPDAFFFSKKTNLTFLVTIAAPLNQPTPQVVDLGTWVFEHRVNFKKDPTGDGWFSTRHWTEDALQSVLLPVPFEYLLSTRVPVKDYQVTVRVLESAKAQDVLKKANELLKKAQEALQKKA
ncbi:MAG: hypothetical protein M9894_22945 [Planctomycetes bacterium]|nr:hypothetical protein [Planctomycetota bacterium]